MVLWTHCHLLFWAVLATSYHPHYYPALLVDLTHVKVVFYLDGICWLADHLDGFQALFQKEWVLFGRQV